jgi:hypothetical protein
MAFIALLIAACGFMYPGISVFVISPVTGVLINAWHVNRRK